MTLFVIELKTKIILCLPQIASSLQGQQKYVNNQSSEPVRMNYVFVCLQGGGGG